MTTYTITTERNGRALVTYFHPEREPYSVSHPSYAMAYNAALAYSLR